VTRAGNARLGQLLTDTLDYHTFPRDVFALAAEAGVRAVALTHFVPAVPAAQAEAVFTQGRAAFAGEVHVGADGTHFALPGGSAEIRVERLVAPP
jgi:ribonuclease BN (tRNA processing enzyme)